MSDVFYLSLGLAFFTVCIGYISLCDRIIGTDADADQNRTTDTKDLTPTTVTEVAS